MLGILFALVVSIHHEAHRPTERDSIIWVCLKSPLLKLPLLLYCMVLETGIAF